MITVNNLRKAFGDKIVTDVPQLTIDEGQVFGLVGNNGAGKSTLLRLILDLIKADAGEVFLNGCQTSKSEQWKTYTAAYLDESFLIDFLTPEEFFYFIGKIGNQTKAEVNKKLAVFSTFFNAEILGQKGKLIRDFSKGNKQKIGIASAFISEASVLLFDEPFESLDPSSQINLKYLLKAYRKNKTCSIVISSHDLSHLSDICDRVAIIERGKIVRDISCNTDLLRELNEYFNL